MFDVCTNDYSAFAFPGVTADGSASWAPGGHRGLLAESSEVLEESSGVLHPPLAHFHSSFYSAGGGRRLDSSTSSLSFSGPGSAEGLILPSSWAFVSGKKTESSRKTLVEEDGKNFERTGVH